MINSSKTQIFKISFIVLSLAALSVFAWGNFNLLRTGKSEEKVFEADMQPETYHYDDELLKKFTAVSEKISSEHPQMFISGTINVMGGRDSTASTTSQIYVLNKKNQYLYCRLGQTEMINAPGVYVFVDHALKRMLVSDEKKVIESPGIPDLTTLIKNMKSEGYQLRHELKKDEEEIVMFNDSHITCKAYSLLFNAENLDPLRIQVRLSDREEPLEKKYDQIIEIELKEISATAKAETGLHGLIEKKGNMWVPGRGYELYKIIVI